MSSGIDFLRISVRKIVTLLTWNPPRFDFVNTITAALGAGN
jgi:hypothetical protein